MLCPLGSPSWHERMNTRRLSRAQYRLARSAFDRLDAAWKGFIIREDLRSSCVIDACPIDSPAFRAMDTEGVGRVCFPQVVHYVYPNLAPQYLEACMQAYTPPLKPSAPGVLDPHGAGAWELESLSPPAASPQLEWMPQKQRSFSCLDVMTTMPTATSPSGQ